MAEQPKLTADEIALYDRQIRLWGMQTQLRIRNTKILVINLGSLGTEIVKNLVLGGIDTMEIIDSSDITEDDYGSQFLLREGNVGQKRVGVAIAQIRELNSRVRLTANTEALSACSEDYFRQFDLVIATELEKSDILRVNGITRRLGIPFYSAGVHGMFGYIFSDLIQHESLVERPKGNQATHPGPINRVKNIVEVSNPEKDKEILRTVDTFTSFDHVLKSTQLPQQLNKRQLKRLSPALPLIFALFEFERVQGEETLDPEQLKHTAIDKCRGLGIPSDIVSEQYLLKLSQQAFAEFAPVSGILGGALSQDVINFLSRKQSPINNFLIIDGIAGEMPIFAL